MPLLAPVIRILRGLMLAYESMIAGSSGRTASALSFANTTFAEPNINPANAFRLPALNHVPDTESVLAALLQAVREAMAAKDRRIQFFDKLDRTLAVLLELPDAKSRFVKTVSRNRTAGIAATRDDGMFTASTILRKMLAMARRGKRRWSGFSSGGHGRVCSGVRSERTAENRKRASRRTTNDDVATT
mmetsp:Transcript_30628/g.74634  ORF Transcript_30628/g.74634 Transcript_30628/m.74634 type:complete len:188 (+) Transcript_30628:61-624(+)